MACPLWKLCSKTLNGNISVLSGSIRREYFLRGKPPAVAKSLEQKMKEWQYQDPSIHFKVDIGLPPPQINASVQRKERMKILKPLRHDPNLEKLSRNRQLNIDLEECHKEWVKTDGPQHIKTIADHYGVYEHLFGDAYFYPRVPITVTFELKSGDLPVYYGNVIKPKDAQKKPNVTYESDDKSLWTLILTNPDGHFTEQDKEYVHWFVCNIPGNNIDKGETLIEYMQPFPPKGTGYHRHIFVLYKQDKKLDLSILKKDGNCLSLAERTFSTYDFYSERQDHITPAGLAFFQSDWDHSLKNFYHNILEMKEPIFEYDFEPPYIKKQKWFPIKEPFNLYMDKYRDPKQINKEFLMRKLKNVHPFKAPPPPLPYPNAQRFYDMGYVPSWLKLEITKSRLNWGRIKEIE